MRKPSKRKSKPVLHKPYHVQVGRSAIRGFVHDFGTEAKARGFARGLIDKLEPEFRRYNNDGIRELGEARIKIDHAMFNREHEVVRHEVDAYSGLDVYFEFWRSE